MSECKIQKAYEELKADLEQYKQFHLESYSKLDDINIELNEKIAQLESDLKIALDFIKYVSEGSAISYDRSALEILEEIETKD